MYHRDVDKAAEWNANDVWWKFRCRCIPAAVWYWNLWA